MPPLRCFDDFDHLCEGLRDWNLDLRQLDRGRFQGEVSEAFGRTSFLSYARFERVLEQRGSPPPGVWTFGIPLRRCRPFDWHGARVTRGDIVVLSPGWELDAVSYGGFEIVSFSIAEEQLERLAAAHEIPLRQILSAGSVARRPLAETLPLMRSLRRAIRRPDAAQALMDDAIPAQILAHLSGAERSRPSEPLALRERALVRALSHIEEHGGEPLTVEQLSLATGTSLRTLRRAIGERFGVSPKAYLQARRLNDAFKLLRRADPASVKIADVANRFGFWHMGKFAADYRRQFGELPSQTLLR